MNRVYANIFPLLALAAAGCGGSSSPEPQSPLSPSTVQGIWRSSAGATNTMSAVVLPSGAMWAVISNSSSVRVLKAGIEGQLNGFTASGNSFILGPETKSAITLTANPVAGVTWTGSIQTGAQTENFSLTYQSRYATAAQLADFAGTWYEDLGSATNNWSINSQGVIGGKRTTGCTYIGAVTLRAERKAIVDVTMTETCNGKQVQFSGVAAKSADNTAISMVITNSADTDAVALNLIP